MAKGKRKSKIESWQEQEIKEAEKRRRGRKDVPDGMMPEEDLHAALAQETGAKIIVSDTPKLRLVEKEEPVEPAQKEIQSEEMPKPLMSDEIHESAKIVKVEVKVLEEASDEELVKVEKRIETEFSETEKEFRDILIRKYPKELQVAANKIKKGGGLANDDWLVQFKQSYVDTYLRLGMDKNRWGSNGPLAPEKAKLLEKYLKLKLPAGIPEEKPEITQENSERAKEKLFILSNPVRKGEFSEKRKFSDKQLENLGYLLEVARESSGKLKRSDLEKIVGELIQEELVSRKIFTKDKISDAVEWVMKRTK